MDTLYMVTGLQLLLFGSLSAFFALVYHRVVMGVKERRWLKRMTRLNRKYQAAKLELQRAGIRFPK